MCGRKLRTVSLSLVLLLLSSLPLFSEESQSESCEMLLSECVSRLEIQISETETVLSVNEKLLDFSRRQQTLNTSLMQFNGNLMKQLEVRDEQLDQTRTSFDEYESAVNRTITTERIKWGAGGVLFGALGVLLGGFFL